MPQFYVKPSDYPIIMSRFDYIIKKLIEKAEIKNKAEKAASETFRYLVNRVYFSLKSEEIEDIANNKEA